MGNQLFCYATARRLALVNDAELVLDHVTGFVRDYRYRRRYELDRFHITVRKATPAERMEPFERYRRGLAKFIARRRPFAQRRYLEQKEVDFDARLLSLKVRETIYLDGYWQGEGYFKDIESVIREELRIAPPEDSINQDMAERIRCCNAVAIHVRWFESREASEHKHNVDGTYYRKAVREIRDRVLSPRFFVFSNQPERAMQMLGLSVEEGTCVRHNHGGKNAYKDLWLMSLCRHFVIANSTFSWWGAWLSQEADKVVIAPGIVQSGISSWGFKGLLPREWVKV